ncbi:MAG: YraN family protein [Thermoproteota archaeon]|nr:YraN family protein [Candidatus Brockarchaeota archaeon]
MRKGLDAEDIAVTILEKLGYTVLEKRKPVIVGGVKVAEIDLIARDQEGDILAVEVKSGKASVTDVRQVFSNSKLLKVKPLLVCKGFSDASALSLASELGVRYILLPEYYLLTFEDFKEVSKEIINDLLMLYLTTEVQEINSEEEKIVEAVANSSSFTEASGRLNVSEEELGRMVSSISVFRSWDKQSFNQLRLRAMLVKNRLKEKRLIENIERKLDTLEKKINDLKDKK